MRRNEYGNNGVHQNARAMYGEGVKALFTFRVESELNAYKDRESLPNMRAKLQTRQQKLKHAEPVDWLMSALNDQRVAREIGDTEYRSLEKRNRPHAGRPKKTHRFLVTGCTCTCFFGRRRSAVGWMPGRRCWCWRALATAIPYHKHGGHASLEHSEKPRH